MRARFIRVILVLVASSASFARAQQATTNGATSLDSTVALHSTVKSQEPAPMVLRLTEPGDTNSMGFQLSKTTQVRVGGPLIQPLKAKSGSGFARRLVHLINPFATGEPNVPPAAAGPINTRAWSTIVGWNPGRSAFQDGAWHEPPHLDLLSITTEKQP